MMIVRFLEQHDVIHLALYQLKPDSSDELRVALGGCSIRVLEEISDLLKPFKLVTEIMSSETQCTISSVHPTKFKLLRQMKELNVTSSVASKSRDAIVADLNKRYNDESTDMLLKEACFLDPRYKNLPYLSDNERLNIKEYIISHCAHLINATGLCDDLDEVAMPAGAA